MLRWRTEEHFYKRLNNLKCALNAVLCWLFLTPARECFSALHLFRCPWKYTASEHDHHKIILSIAQMLKVNEKHHIT